jgi:hypothetical protein
MRLGVKTLILALVVALLAVPAAFAKGGHGGGKPSWAGGGGHGKPSWAGGGHANGHAKADKAKGKEKKHGRAGAESAESELTPEDLEGLNPAWYCKTFRSMMEDDGQDFYEHFGTNPNDANGFGMCVYESAQGGDPAEGVELSNEEAACEAPTDEGLSDEGTTEEGTSDDETLGEDVTTEEGDELTTEEGDDLTTEEGGDASDPAGDEECEAADDGASDDGASGDDSDDDLSGDDLSGDEAGADETVAAFARTLVSFIRV